MPEQVSCKLYLLPHSLNLSIEVKVEIDKISQNAKSGENNSELLDHFLVKWLKQYKNVWQMKYLAMVLFEINLNKFFNMFILDNKKVLFFSIEQFELKSGEGFKIAD